MKRSRLVESVIAVSTFGLLALIFVQFAPIRGATVGAADIITHHTTPFLEERPNFTSSENSLQTDQTDGIALAAAFWEDLRKGDLKLWDSDLGTGAPLGGAIYTRVWSPFYWIGLVVPGRVLSSFAVWLTLWCAQLGAWALARYIGLGQIGALFAGVAFGFSGPSTALLLRINEIALAPWVFLGVHACVDRSRMKPIVAVAGLAIAVGAMWLGGFPAGSIFTLYGAGTVAVCLAVIKEGWSPRALARRLVLPLAGVVTGTALVAPILLPSYEFLAHSESLERSYPSSHSAGLPLFGTSVSGRLLGTYQDKTWWWPDPGYSNPVEASMTMGAVALLVLAVGASSRRSALSPCATRYVSKIYLPLGAVVFMGTFIGGPVLAALQVLPFVGSNSFGRSRFLLSLAIALAAGLALDDEIHRDQGPQREKRFFRLFATAFVGLALVSTALVANRAVDEGMLDRVLAALVVPGACALLAAIGVIVIRTWRTGKATHRKILGFAIAMILAVELQWGAWEFTPVLDPNEPFYPDHEMFDLMRPDVSEGPYRFAGTALNVVRPNSSALLDLADLRISNPSYERYRELMRAMDPDVFERARLRTWFTDQLDPSSPGLDRSAVKYLVAPSSAGILEAEPAEIARLHADSLNLRAGEPVRGIGVQVLDKSCDEGFLTVLHEDSVVGRIPLRTAVDQNLDVPLEDLYGPATVRLITDRCAGRLANEVTVYRAKPDSQIELLWADDGVLYRRRSPRPRFELATEVMGIADKSQRLEALLDPDLSDVSILDHQTERRTFDGGTVELEADEGDYLRLRVDSRGPGLLVVRDANAPGWAATVNREPVEVFHVDHVFRGVYVPEGTSVVEMVYAPRSMRLGGALAGVALLVLTIWGWRSRASRKVDSVGSGDGHA